MPIGRMPSSPAELRRWVEMTEERPEEEHGWARLGRELSPGRRAWIEEMLRELFIERVLGTRGSVAVICNIARRAGLAGLTLFFARYLEEPLESWSDADIRCLMGALLELDPAHVDPERVAHHGQRADVFAVALHLLAAIDEDRALDWLRAHIAQALEAAAFPERILDSLAKLFLTREPLRPAFIQALSAALTREQAGRFVGALTARVAQVTDARVGPAMEALHQTLERLVESRVAASAHADHDHDRDAD